MTYISVTRLRLRSPRFLPAFVWHAFRSERQARRSNGCRGVRAMRDSDGSFWTVSAWENREAMRAYVTTGAHRQAVPKLVKWCDEASTVHWEQEAAVGLPGWTEARRRMAVEGRPYKLPHASPAQAATSSRA
jgi:quinol monooxygenase YgiN